jgi:hypothetical protein
MVLAGTIAAPAGRPLRVVAAHMIDVIRRYEQTKPKRHPIWMTFQWDGMDGPGTNQNLFESTAEAISPGSASGTSRRAYERDPPAATGNKVVIVDTDHVNPGNLDRAERQVRSSTVNPSRRWNRRPSRRPFPETLCCI